MPENTPGFTPSATAMPPYSLLGGGENLKLLFDTTMALMTQGVADNQQNARAWAALNLRKATQGLSYDHAVDMGSVLAAQAGTTEQQAQVTPIRTGAGDNLAAGAAPINRVIDYTGATAAGAEQTANAAVSTANAAVAASIANLATALVPIVAGTSGVVTVQTLAAMLALVVNSVGQAAPKSTT